MFYEFWETFFDFWTSVGLEKVIRLFWYFFLLELPRYLFFDFLVTSLFLFNRHRNNKREKVAHDLFWAESPLISIIVPGKNEGLHLPKLVKSLSEQTYQNFELIFIDDGSTDETPIIGRRYEKEGLITMFLRNDQRGGKASAANLGLFYSKGKILVHLDADSSFDRNAIENICIPFYYNDKIGAVGGNVKVRNADTNILTSLQAIEYLQTVTMGRMVSSQLGIYKIISGAFGAFRKDILVRLGGWDVGPGLDGDITVKFRKLGYRIEFEPKAVCLTNVPTRAKKLTNQRLRWSKSLIRFRVRKHKDILLPDQNFNIYNFASSLENIFFNVVLDALWFYYMIDLVITNPHILVYMLILKLFLYSFNNLLQFLLLTFVSERGREEFRLLPFIPLMTFYTGYYMRFVRTAAYIREWFFYSSFKDPWNPKKSSTQARIHNT